VANVGSVSYDGRGAHRLPELVELALFELFLSRSLLAVQNPERTFGAEYCES
jgi:hypothetical protein